MSGWDNPNWEPLNNGPMRAVTSPNRPKCFLSTDGRFFEFLVPFPFHVVDQQPWQSIVMQVEGHTFVAEPPVRSTALYQADGRGGNESPDAYCTIIRVLTQNSEKVEADEVWRIVAALLGWIRIKARHFWLLHGGVGYGAQYRGSVFGRTGQEITQKNYAVYGPACVVRPLTEPLWLTLKNELETKQPWPLAESVFCDALLSWVAGDHSKAALEAGVASEVAITQLLDAVSAHRPASPGALQWVKHRGEWDSFSKKLKEWPQRMGLEPVNRYSRQGLSSSWVADALEGYRQRGGVAHAGKISPALRQIDVSSFILATNGLLQYCRDQRTTAELANYSMPVGLEPHQQIRCFREGSMGYESNELSARLL